MSLRKLELADYHKSYLALLETLTVVGQISEADFGKRFQILNRKPYMIWVIEDLTNDTIVATGTLVIEEKFIHNLGKVGHIEDIVVSPKYQGKSLGKMIIEQLITSAKEQGCYKVILDCSDKVRSFYEKCGFHSHSHSMRLDLYQNYDPYL